MSGDGNDYVQKQSRVREMREKEDVYREDFIVTFGKNSVIKGYLRKTMKGLKGPAMWYLLEAFQVMEQEPERPRGGGRLGIFVMTGMGKHQKWTQRWTDVGPVCRERWGRIEGWTVGGLRRPMMERTGVHTETFYYTCWPLKVFRATDPYVAFKYFLLLVHEAGYFGNIKEMPPSAHFLCV